LPLRLVLRSHSSAETTTTARCPFRVMVWGPRVWARSTTWLNFALATATVHVSELPQPSWIVTIVIIVI
jgi:hypothetical protein